VAASAPPPLGVTAAYSMGAYDTQYQYGASLIGRTYGVYAFGFNNTNGTGVFAQGYGTGNGVYAVGGNNGGIGVSAYGYGGTTPVAPTTGLALDANGGGAGAGVRATGGPTDGVGVNATGQGAGAGVIATAGATGAGIVALAAGASPAGLAAGQGLNATAAGTAAGVYATGGATGGAGVYATGGGAGGFGVWGNSTGSTGVYGNSTTGWGVVGQSAQSAGVNGNSSFGAGGQFYGGRAQIWLVPAAGAGPPSTGAHSVGDVWMDSRGTAWICVISGTPGNFMPLQPGNGTNPATRVLFTAVSSQQYTLTNSDGVTWADMDSTSATPLLLTITPAFNCQAILSGNSDLWTSVAAFNQDIAIVISGGAYGTGQVVAWKESGGFAGTFSPNAAFVQTVQPLAAGTAYTIKLQWKANRAGSSTIWAGAGPAAPFSPTRLTVLLIVSQ
jgi:hypothetical protein